MRFTIDSDYAVMSMVSAGLGFSVLSGLILRDAPFPLAIVPPEVETSREIALALRSRKTASTATRAFAEHAERWIAATYGRVSPAAARGARGARVAGGVRRREGCKGCGGGRRRQSPSRAGTSVPSAHTKLGRSATSASRGNIPHSAAAVGHPAALPAWISKGLSPT